MILLIGTLFLSDFLVPLIFGDQWIDAIIIIKYLSVVISLRFVVASLSPVFILEYLPRYDIMLQVLYFIISLTFMIAAKEIFDNYLSVIISYILASVIFYIIYFLTMNYFSNKPLKIL